MYIEKMYIMKISLKIKALIVLAVMALMPDAAGAQTWEQWDYLNNLKDSVERLLRIAQEFHEENVAPLERQLNALPAEVSKGDVDAMIQDVDAAAQELEKLTARRQPMRKQLNDYIVTLLSSRCNPQAVAAMSKYSDPSMRVNLELLKNYEQYSLGLKAPLESLRTALEQNGWRRLDESSAAMQAWDKAWDAAGYISYISNHDDSGIPFLDECVSRVMSMRLRGFDNCRADLEQLLTLLTPAASEATNPAKYDSLIADEAAASQRIGRLSKHVDGVGSQLSDIDKTNRQFNVLDKQRYEAVELWYDKREKIDKMLIGACRYVLSQPCDTVGGYKGMCKQLTPLLDNVFHKSYRAQRDGYLQLLADYERSTADVANFLKRIFVYVRSGKVNETMKSDIKSSLQSLDYYKTYYATRNNAKPVSSPHLDGIVADFEKMLANNFADGKEPFQQLSERLRGDYLYYVKLDEAAEERIKGRTFTVNGVSFIMVFVEGGTFTMGATPEQGNEAEGDENPSHQVIVSSFMIGQTEVTQELWEAVMGSNPSKFKGVNRPVEHVSWDDCQEFIKKLNALTGQHFRLPNEAEWEYAARGGSKSRGYKYSGSNNIDDVAWYENNSGSDTHNVATKQPNELGLYDMSGNVWEWCQDWYGNYSSSSQSNPQGPASGSHRVYRGGSWGNFARFCRVANRDGYSAVNRNDNRGMRLAL